MKQSTFSAQVANNLLTVLQGYSKTIRLLLVMFLTLTVTTNAWADTHTIGWGSATGTAGTYTNFTATSGTVTDVVSFSTAKNSASSNPAYNSSDKELRLYYNSGGNGCSITLTPATDVTITAVTITASSTSYTPTVKYNVNGGGTDITGTWSSATMTISGINATTSLKIRNANTANKQLRIKTIQITYTAAASCNPITPSLSYTPSSLSVGGTANPTLTGNSGNGSVTYSSSNTSVATVNASTGIVTAKAAGTTTITATIAANNGYCEGTATANVTVTADPYTVKFYKTSTTFESVTETSAGAGVTPPTMEEECGDWTFQGWSESQSNSETSTTELELVTLTDGKYYPTEDVNLYPVYTKSEGGGGTVSWNKITTAPADWSGEYLIVNSNYAMTSDFYSGTSGEFKGASVTVSNNQVTSSPSDKMIWIVEKNGSSAQYSFKNKSTGTYAKITGTSSTNAALSSSVIWFTISSSSTSGVWKINSVDNSARCFAYYSTNKTFRTYANSSNTTGSLYRKEGSGSTTYYYSYPDCGSTPDPIGYTITYNTNGGDVIAATSGTALPNPLPTPTRQHYTFVGWYTDESCTQAATAGATIDADITLYAKWTPKVYLTILHPQDGVLLDTNGTQQDSIIIEYVYGTSDVDIPVANYYQSITREGYKFKGWYNATSGGSKWPNIAQGKNQNLWAQWLEERTVTYYSIGQVYDTQTYGNGETLTLPTTNPTACDGYTFVGWTTAEQSETTTKPTLVSNTTVVSSDMILYAVYAVNSGVAETKTDILTRSLTGVSGTTYTAWSGKTATSSAVYAGQSAGDNEAIQLRSKNSNSGIITTASGGKVTKVEVEWQSGTSSGRTLDVYGKNSTYSNVTDLYNTSSQGTKLGSIIYGTSTELEITGDYEYVGLRSKDGAMYLTSISITWSSGSTTLYTTSPNCCPVNLEKPQVTYSVADGAVTLNWTMVNNESDVADYTVACVGGEIHTTTATSYTFTGLTNCTEYTFTVKANGDGTDVCSSGVTAVTATPAAGSFTVTFDYGAGEGTPTQWTSGCANGTSTTLPTPTMLPDNHTFEGWYDGTNLYAAGANYTPTSDVTLYARYTRNTAVDIVEWSPDAVTIEINTEGSAQVQIENEVEHGLGVGSAEELFFSKYYEASYNVKLVAIYNGTKNIIDLTDYTIEYGKTSWESDYIALKDFGSTKGQIQPGEEIILYSMKDGSEDEDIMDCVHADYPDGNWVRVTQSNNTGGGHLSFAGDKTLVLRKSGEIIDIIGAVTSSGLPTNAAVTRPSWGDNTGWTCATGLSIADDTQIGISTNRCLLIRNNTVTSGENAVTSNIDDFVTLCSEWKGAQVPDNNVDNGVAASCENFTYVGVFDYSAYYVSYDSLTRVDLGGNQNADGTYTIPVPELDTLSCTKMRIQVLDNNGASLASSEYKVPIMVKSSGVTTTDELFSKHGIEGCRDCDVVILKNATLQKASDGTANDMPEVRDMEVYAGGKLVVPNGTNYTMRKLVMRSKGDEVPVAEIDGTAVISDKLYHAKRIDAQKFYFFTLPYDCAVSDITYYNGEVLGARGIDYVIKYYDGVGRANGQNAGHWEEFTGATLKAGVGYILAVDASLNGDFDDNPKKEFLFPMTKTLTETSNKTVAVGTWGIGDATIGDNHKGWNLIGTPFMSHYNPISATGLKVGTYTDGEWNSERTIFTYNESVTVPYVTMPNADGKTYTQRLASSQDLEPFKSFFIQVGKEGDVITDVAFSSAERLSKAPRRAPAVDATVWVELELKNTSGSDFTTIILDENCTADYEIGADLEKMLGYAALPQFYSLQSNARLAFNALPSEFASVSIPLGFYAPKSDTYTIALNTENTQNLEGVYLTDNVAGTVTNLLLDDYTFSSAKVLNETRFSIAVVRAVTAVDNVLAENDLVSIVNSYDLHIKNAPIGSELRVYDTLGREVISDQIDAEQKVYYLHTAGVYHVQIVLKDKKSVYKVVSY